MLAIIASRCSINNEQDNDMPTQTLASGDQSVMDYVLTCAVEQHKMNLMDLTVHKNTNNHAKVIDLYKRS